MDINPIQLVTIAKQASDSFLKQGSPLNDAIAKLAEQHELNPMQIRRVAEYANHEVQGSLYKGADDKSFTFSLADPSQIIQTLQVPETQTKLASTDVIEAAYHRTTHRREAIKTAAERFISSSETNHRELKDCQYNLNKLAQHLQHFARETDLRQMVVQSEIETCMNKIARMGKDHIILNNGQLSDLLKYACNYDPESAHMFKVVFDNIKEDLMKLGAPVDKSLINDKLEIPNGELEIINGAHTLAIELDTLKNKISDEDRLAKRIRLLDTFGDAVVDRIRVLRTPEDMNKSILEDSGQLSKKAEEGIEAFVELLEKESGFGTKALIAGIPLSLLAGAGGMALVGGAAKGASKKLHGTYNLRRDMKRRTAD